jgi:hypothetical protein
MPDMVPESRNLMVKLRHKTKSLLRWIFLNHPV